MKIVVAGGTGFVGKALVNELADHGHQIIILTRNGPGTFPKDRVQYVKWLGKNKPAQALQGTDIFINLAGESINGGRWTEDRKKAIQNSRIEAVQELLTIIKELNPKPLALLNASAIGFYGTSENKVFSEEDVRSGNDFLAQTVSKWEREAHKAADIGIRTVFCRFGIILDRNEGALPKMVTPYKAFIGGNLGTGRQWMSWIHIDDVVRACVFCIEHENIRGPVNFTAPNPVPMREFGRTLGSVLHRPHWFPVPAALLKLMLGEMSMLVVTGQKVLPQKLIDYGYRFLYADLKRALENIFAQN